jgi:preprotein translocase subunit SecD
MTMPRFLTFAAAALLSASCASAPEEPQATSMSTPGLASSPCTSIEVVELAPENAITGRLFPTMDQTMVRVSDQPLATTRDISAARAGTAEGSPVLEIDLHEAPAARLREFSAEHVGVNLAFIVNGRVRKVVRILDPILGSGFIIDPVTRFEADALAQSLRLPSSDCTNG